MTVISRTAETNAVSDYFVSRLAGPRIGKRRVQKGDRLSLTEYQARALLQSGELVDDKSKVDDPHGEVAAAKAREEAAAKVAADEAAAKAQAEAEAEAARKAAEAEEAAEAARKAAVDAGHGDDASGTHADVDHHDDAHG